MSNAVLYSCLYNGGTNMHLNGENVSPSINKIKPSLKIFVSDYHFICDCFVYFDEFNILANKGNKSSMKQEHQLHSIKSIWLVLIWFVIVLQFLVAIFGFLYNVDFNVWENIKKYHLRHYLITLFKTPLRSKSKTQDLT